LKPALEKMRKGNRTEITEILSKSGHPECPICLVSRAREERREEEGEEIREEREGE
jgi:hypothetical protein